jgi:hypothetical protein
MFMTYSGTLVRLLIQLFSRTTLIVAALLLTVSGWLVVWQCSDDRYHPAQCLS